MENVIKCHELPALLSRIRLSQGVQTYNLHELDKLEKKRFLLKKKIQEQALNKDKNILEIGNFIYIITYYIGTEFNDIKNL
jgi:hypothetical protein